MSPASVEEHTNALPDQFSSLGTWLQQTLGLYRLQVQQCSMLDGGAIQENWLLRLLLQRSQDASEKLVNWVLRTDSPSTLSTSHTRSEEFAILKVVFEAGVKVPEPLVLCEDESVIGRSFYIMEHAQGDAHARKITRSPMLHDFGPNLAAELGNQLAIIHQVTADQGAPSERVLEFLSTPPSDPAAARIARYRQDLDQLPVAAPLLEYGLNWLDDHRPTPQTVCLCHCDYRTGNFMVHDGKLQAVLDWEFASWSDPYEDLGWFSARCWRFANPQLEAGGLAELSCFLNAYTGVSGQILSQKRIAWWQVMAEIRWSIIALQQAQRHYSGQQISLELALTDRLVPEMEYNLMQAIAEYSNDASPDPFNSYGNELNAAAVSKQSAHAPSDKHQYTLQYSNNFRQRALIDAAISELENKLLPQAQSGQRYSCAMLKRTLQILNRELEFGSELADKELLQTVYREKSASKSLAELAHDIRLQNLKIDDAALYGALLHYVKQRLAVNNPAILPEHQPPNSGI